jgi:hypothetical protein
MACVYPGGRRDEKPHDPRKLNQKKSEKVEGAAATEAGKAAKQQDRIPQRFTLLAGRYA